MFSRPKRQSAGKHARLNPNFQCLANFGIRLNDSDTVQQFLMKKQMKLLYDYISEHCEFNFLNSSSSNVTVRKHHGHNSNIKMVAQIRQNDAPFVATRSRISASSIISKLMLQKRLQLEKHKAELKLARQQQEIENRKQILKLGNELKHTEIEENIKIDDDDN